MELIVVTGAQVIAHGVGDYVLQTDWMATTKTKSSWATLVHVLLYGLAFVVFCRPSVLALAVVVGTHFVIDRWRLARYVVWAKEWITWLYVRPLPWAECAATGYPTKPPFMAVWLMILVDQIMHLLCNSIALRYL